MSETSVGKSEFATDVRKAWLHGSCIFNTIIWRHAAIEYQNFYSDGDVSLTEVELPTVQKL
jgi:hypothetical protein